MRRIIVSSFAAWITACPAPTATSTGASTSTACTSHGEKCKTPGGPLGVCDTITCAEGTPGPCFKCMPQH